MTWLRALALALAVGSPGMLARVPVDSGVLIQTIATVDGPVRVFRWALGCRLTFRGVLMDIVSREVCAA